MRGKTSRTAVIYCRVSSTKQTTRGDGLGSQETRCREYAKYKQYTVATVFTDDLSGSLIDRPGMKAMLAYLRKHRREACVVIIDDISRLARGLEAHLQLRGAIANAGGVLESPSIEFGEDSDSVLVENLLASVSQHQRQKNGEQTVNRMRARIMNGYWPTEANVSSVIRAYEERIRKLEEQKAAIVEQIANCGRPVRSFDETVRTALDFLGNPWKLWSSERLEDSERC